MSQSGGRPSKLTEELQSRICQLIEAGADIELACGCVGISTATYRSWMAQGRNGVEPFAGFLAAATCARQKAELALLMQVRKGDEKKSDFVGRSEGARWLLERTRGNKYAARVNVKVQEELESLLDIAEKVLQPEQFAILLEAIAAQKEDPEALSGVPEEPVH